MREKLAITGLVILLALFALIVKLWRIGKEDGDAYNQKVLSQQRYDSRDIPYRRGDIVDRNGTVLATTNKVYNLIIDPSQINSRQEDYLDATADALAEIFGYSREKVRETVIERSESHYVRFDFRLSGEQKRAFEDYKKEKNDEYKKDNNPARIHGVWFEDAYLRVYPYNAMGCNVIGFSTSEGAEGSGGIEQYYNSRLIGTAGREYGYLNEDSDLERVIKPAVDGSTIVSTIDVKVQSTIEKYIDQFENEMGGNTVAVLVMDPGNGEVLGMATNRKFDLNHPAELTSTYTNEEIEAMDAETKTNTLSQLWRNFIVSDTFEPGSTSKIFTVAAGIENGAISGEEYYDCNGSLDVGGWTIHCGKRTGHGPLNITEGIMQSCNVVMMRICQALGKEKFCRIQRLFGFGSRTGIDLPGEAETSTLIHTVDNMSSSDLATNSFGQNYNCSMIQMAAAFSSAINGGSYYQPHVVKQILNSQGAVIQDIQPELVRETVSSDTSAFLRNALFRTVSEGTGKAAGVEGYDIGGKTGTAEKYPRGTGNYLVSFCGFAPVDNPEVLCYVIVDTPHTADQAHSTYASGIFHNIMAEILPYLNVYPNTVGEEDTGFVLPVREGINDSTTETQEPVRPQITYDTEEVIQGAAEGGSPENIPGVPAGAEGEGAGVPAEDAGAGAAEEGAGAEVPSEGAEEAAVEEAPSEETAPEEGEQPTG